MENKMNINTMDNILLILSNTLDFCNDWKKEYMTINEDKYLKLTSQEIKYLYNFLDDMIESNLL